MTTETKQSPFAQPATELSGYAWVKHVAGSLPIYMGAPVSRMQHPHCFYIEDYVTITVWRLPDGDFPNGRRSMHTLYKRTGQETAVFGMNNSARMVTP